jgi:hypothetical protein
MTAPRAKRENGGLGEDPPGSTISCYKVTKSEDKDKPNRPTQGRNVGNDSPDNWAPVVRVLFARSLHTALVYINPLRCE